MKLASKHGVSTFWKYQALATMLSFSSMPLPCHITLQSLLQDGCYAAPSFTLCLRIYTSTSYCFAGSPSSRRPYLQFTGTSSNLGTHSCFQASTSWSAGFHDHHLQCACVGSPGSPPSSLAPCFAGTIFCFTGTPHFASTLPGC